MLAPISIREEAVSPKTDEFLARQPGGLIYDASSYTGLIDAMARCRTSQISCYQNGALVAFMPIATRQAAGFKVVNSLPYFGSHGGPLIDVRIGGPAKEQLLDALLSYLNSYCAANNIDAITIVTNPFLEETADWLVENFKCDHSVFRVGQYQQLPAKGDGVDAIEAALQACFDPLRMRNIRKAQKSGVTIRKSMEWPDFFFLYEASKLNMEANGLSSKTVEFYRYVFEQFSAKNSHLYIAEQGGAPIAALLNLSFNGNYEYFVPATLHEHRNSQPSSLLIYESMKDAAINNGLLWNWGGSGDGTGGVYDFKKKWGASDSRYYYLNKIYNPEILLLTPEDLKNNFPYFFVAPFDKLLGVPRAASDTTTA